MSKSKQDREIRDRSEELLLNTYKRYPVVLVEGNGSRVRDIRGREYIDVLAGIAVNNVGHCHPRVVEAIREQAAKLIHVSNYYYNEPQHRLAEALTAAARMEKVFLSNSGAEALEAAVKLARRHGDRKGKQGPVISMENCFHGRTIGTIALGKEKYRKGFGPMPGNIESVPFNDIEALEAKVDEETVAIFIEPLQGEGGVIPAATAFLKRARELCDDYDALLVFDEVQCGMGRTGELFAWMHSGVSPDILCTAKGLGGGLPIGATLVTKETAALVGYGEHGTTFGGNPVACAAACAVLDVIEEEDLCRRATETGEWLMEQLRKRTADWEAVRSVRGMGLMVGVELAFKGAEVVEKMLEKGVLSNCASDVVIRLVPPLNISREDLSEVIDVLIESIRECEKAGAERTVSE